MSKVIADKILLSDAMFDAVADQPQPGGVAIKGNKIIAAGSKEEVLQYQGAETKITDYGEHMLMPGFCDSHIHLLLGSMFACEVDLSSAKSEEECAKMLYDFYKAEEDTYEDGEWVLGFSWYHLWWDNPQKPTRKTLDKYFPDRPVFLLNADAHAAWVNSKALEIAGADKNFPDVPYGTINRFEDGEPTGFLEELAMDICLKYAYKLPYKKEWQLLKNALPIFNSRGVTSVNDMQYFFGTNMGRLDVYQDMAKSGELTMRINFANGLLDDLDETRKLRQTFGDPEGLVYHNGVKEFIDGIVTTYTAVILEPYCDKPEAPLSFELMDLEKAAKNIKILQKEGMNVHLHATGDGAVRKAKEFYAAAIAENGQTNSRLSIEHLDMTKDEDLAELGKLGVIASVQPRHLALTDSLETSDYLPVVGEERAKHLWAYHSMEEAGMPLAFGTDYPIVSVDPLLGLYRAVTRIYPDGKPEGGWNPEQRISLSNALKAYTAGGAYMCGKEDVLGTLEAGKLADITVIEKNLFAVPAEEMLDCKVLMTMVNGEEVYQD